MGVKKISASDKATSQASEAKKKTILQQVMKPKDWVAMGVLIVISAFCWMLVLNAYQESINMDDFVSVSVSESAIDKNGDL